MKDISVEQIKVLSDPNRLAILSSSDKGNDDIPRLGSLGLEHPECPISYQEAPGSGSDRPDQDEMVGNLVEKYYRSQFEPGMVISATDADTVDISERLNLVFAAIGAIKGYRTTASQPWTRRKSPIS
jgi:DNA-binding transcriptional ArsR family regulator